MKRFALTLCFSALTLWGNAQINYETTQTTQGLWGIGANPAGKTFVVGNNGVVITKEPSCETWQPVTVPVTAGLRDIAFIDDSVGVIVGVSGNIIRTTNAGETWTSVTSGVSSGLLFVKSMGQQSFIAGGGGSSGNLIIQSNNGGVTWDTLITTLPSSPFDAVVISDSVIITCGVMGTVFRSTDAGITWNQINDTNLTGTLTAMGFMDEQNGFIAAQNGNIFKTTDGGLTWNTTTTGVTAFLNALYIDQSNTIYAAGNSGTFIQSTDTGTTWSSTTLPFNTALRVIGEDNFGLLAGGNSGLLFRFNPSVGYDIIFKEDFCNFTDSVVPANGWSNLSGVDTNSVWRFDNPSSNGLQAVFDAPFAVYDAQLYNNTGRDSAILSTGDFSTDNYSELTLRWREAFLPNQDGQVTTIIQGWDGASWVTVYESDGAHHNGIRTASYTGPNISISTHRSIDLSNMGNLSSTRIRFIFVAEGSGPRFWWGIDDIEVLGGRRDLAISQLQYNDTLCNLPATDDVQVTVTNLSDFPVFPIQLAWQIGNGPVQHRYYVAELEANQDTVITLSSIDVNGIGALNVWIADAYDRDFSNDTVRGFYGNAALMFSLGDTIRVCQGDSLALYSGVTADQYIWNGNAQSDTLWVNTSGWYTLEVTQGLCNNIDSVWVYVTVLPVNVLGNLPAAKNQFDSIVLPLTAAGETRYTVSFPDGSITDTVITSNWTFTLADTGTYQVSLEMTTQNCIGVEQHQIVVSDPLSTDKQQLTAAWTMHPNPSSGWIILQNADARFAELVDLNGNIVFAIGLREGTEHRRDLPALAQGMSIVRLTTRDGQVTTRRIIIQNP